jgi:hypothetical protein
MRYEKNGSLTADAKKLSDIWLGTANDLLDRGKIEFYSRNQLVVIRDILGNAIADTGPVQKTFVTKYRENTRRINEMKFLQSYQPKLVDAAGVMQFEAVRNMLAEIEHETANNPGSLAPDISTETLARLYSLRDNWDNPARLS